MSVEEGSKETFADTKLCEARSSEEEPNKAQRNPLNINIDFSQWLEALFIALKYRRGISKEPSQVTKNEMYFLVWGAVLFRFFE